MTKKRSFSHLFWFAFPALFFVTQVIALANPAKIDERDARALKAMDDAIKMTVESSQVDVIGQGSWVSGGKYSGPLSGGTSDHDMRVLLLDETDRGTLIKKWKAFQQELKKNIAIAANKYGIADQKAIEKLIKSTNVYPPNQITNTFVDEEDAASFFRKNGSPRLDSAPTDGIFTPGGPGFRQAKEITNGRHWRYDKATGSVVKTSTDLIVMTEGYEQFFTAGEAGNAQHWAEEIIGDLNRGDMRALQKHAERLRTSINKARNLERVGLRADYLDDIVSGKVKDPSAIREVVARAKQDANLLLALSQESSARNRTMIIGFLNENLGKWAKMRNAFWKWAGRVPMGKLLRAFQIYTYYARTMDLSKITDPHEFNAAVLKNSAVELSWLAGPLAGISSEIADAVLTCAREGAFAIVTAFQECSDLVAGIHSVKGREDLVPGLSIEQLARKFADDVPDRERLDNFIRAHAAQAASRLENNRWVTDPNIERVLYAKCRDAIFARWYDKRLDVIDEFNRLFTDWVKMMYVNQAALILFPDTNEVVLKAQPGGPPAARVRVKGSMTESPEKVEDLKKRMNAKLRTLEGERNLDVLTLNSEFRLLVNGRTVSISTNPDAIEYELLVDRAGEYTVRLEHEYALTALFQSEDICQNTPFITQTRQGYTKRYLKRATASFTAVEEEMTPGGTISVTGPKVVSPEPAANKDQKAGGATTSSPGAKASAETAEAVLEEYRSLYPAYLQKLNSGMSIEMKANATPSGDKYLCSYIAWDVIKDGPRKGERYKAVDFTRLFTLSDLKGFIPGMKKLLGR